MFFGGIAMAKVDNLLRCLKFAEDETSHYEAHQISRTLYYRYMELQKFEVLADFLFEKCKMFEAGKQF